MRRLVTYAITLVVLLFALSPTLVQAGVTGRIEGKITNSETGEALVGVSVSVVGTDLGAVTDADGAYFILQVPVGKHQLLFSSVGFAPLTVSNVSVSADKTTGYDAVMKSSTTELEGIAVIVEQPLVEKGRTMSVTTMRAEEIQKLPTRGYQQVVGLQSGVVTFRQSAVNRGRGGREASTSPELNIRGGRPTSVTYLVDGFSQQDPLSGLSTTAINNNAIAEVSVITGGFPAEYGYVSAGVVNTITKSGGKNYSGGVELVTDEILGDEGYKQTNAALNIGGPLPGVENGTFFFSGEKIYHGDRQPSAIAEDLPESLRNGSGRLLNNSLNGFTFQGKIRYNFSPSVVLQLAGNGSREKWQEYRHNQVFNSPHNPRYDDQNYGFSGKLTHTLSPSTYYNLSAGFFRTERERGDGIFWNDLSSYTNDEFKGDAVNTGNSDINLFYEPGSTAVPGGYLNRISSYLQFKGDLTTKPHPDHLIKTGFDVQRHTLKRYNHIRPFNVADKTDSTSRWQDANYYGFNAFGVEGDIGDGLNDAKKPSSISLYVQDRINWNGMILTTGLRFDYFDYSTKEFVDPTRPLSIAGAADSLDPGDLQDADSDSRISPRLGVAFPLDEQTNMHFSYGKFFKRPDLDKLYTGFNYLEYKIPEGGYYFPVGNPNLEPEKTTAYELGISHGLSDNTALNVTAFYKDIKDLIQVKTQSSDLKQFNIFQNADFATVKGLELGLVMRRVRSIQMDLKYTLSSAKGTGSFANTQRNVAWTADNAPLQASPLAFDQRHTFTALVDIRRSGSESGSILDDAGISTVVKYSSGTPFTKSIVFNEVSLAAVSPRADVPVNSVYGPATFSIDMKADKTFNMGRAKINAYVWVENLINKNNATFVYESSGSPNSTGWLNSAPGESFVASTSVPDPIYGDMTGGELYELRQNDPTNYGPPRIIKFGLNLFF